MRTALLIALAAAALAAALFSASELFRAGIGTDAPASPGAATAPILLHLAAAAIGAIALSSLSPSPNGADHAARTFLYLSLAVPLPGIGLALAALLAAAIFLTKPQKNTSCLFRTGNPYAHPVTGNIGAPGDHAVFRSAEPLTSRIRGTDLADLRALAIGLRGLPSERVTPVLERLQKDPDTFLQLYAQGDAAEAAESAESLLRTLTQDTRQNPGDHTARLAFATHLLHLASSPTLAHDQRANFLALALEQLEPITTPRAHALRAAIHTLDGQPDSADAALGQLVASDPDFQSVSRAETALLRANLLHLNRDWRVLASHLADSPELAADPAIAPVQLFFAAAH